MQNIKNDYYTVSFEDAMILVDKNYNYIHEFGNINLKDKNKNYENFYSISIDKYIKKNNKYSKELKSWLYNQTLHQQIQKESIMQNKDIKLGKLYSTNTSNEIYIPLAINGNDNNIFYGTAISMYSTSFDSYRYYTSDIISEFNFSVFP